VYYSKKTRKECFNNPLGFSSSLSGFLFFLGGVLLGLVGGVLFGVFFFGVFCGVLLGGLWVPLPSLLVFWFFFFLFFFFGGFFFFFFLWVGGFLIFCVLLVGFFSALVPCFFFFFWCLCGLGFVVFFCGSSRALLRPATFPFPHTAVPSAVAPDGPSPLFGAYHRFRLRTKETTLSPSFPLVVVVFLLKAFPSSVRPFPAHLVLSEATLLSGGPFWAGLRPSNSPSPFLCRSLLSGRALGDASGLPAWPPFLQTSPLAVSLPSIAHSSFPSPSKSPLSSKYSAAFLPAPFFEAVIAPSV